MIANTRVSKKYTKPEAPVFNRICVASVDINLTDPQTDRSTRERVLFGIHEATGLVAGYQLASPGADAARLVFCIRNCLLPKNALLEQLHLRGEWPVHGLFDAVNVPNSLVVGFEPILRGLFENYRMKLETRPNQASLPAIVEATLRRVAHRMEEAFCLDESEIEDYPMLTPNIGRRIAQHAFSFRPRRGFVERIAAPPEWDKYRYAHPLKPVDDYFDYHIRRDFDQVAGACFTCQYPGPTWTEDKS